MALSGTLAARPRLTRPALPGRALSAVAIPTMSDRARPLSTNRRWVLILVMCACVTPYIGCCCCCETPVQVRGLQVGQFRGLAPVSKLDERRVGTDAPSSAASPCEHRRRPQARPGRARAPARGAVDAGRSTERRAPESELVPVCRQLRSSRTRWYSGAGLGRSARRRTRRPCACRHPRQLLERRQPVVATLAASVFSGRRRDRRRTTSAKGERPMPSRRASARAARAAAIDAHRYSCPLLNEG
eukprot:scaffold73676_cov58-Phaeocystis_antarctica.AAC.3